MFRFTASIALRWASESYKVEQKGFQSLIITYRSYTSAVLIRQKHGDQWQSDKSILHAETDTIGYIWSDDSVGCWSAPG